MIPIISIIIPMYNAEKFIAECLTSLLNQTLKNFEVIVVDDCSTDNSYTIVKNYLRVFNRNKEVLRLIHSEKNSGSPGSSRNKGIEIAHGKYLYFVDSDDAIIDTALEELYTAAENFQADIVHTEKFFRADNEKISTNKNFLTVENLFPNTDFVTAPTFITPNIYERIDKFIARKFDWSTCHNFIRRDFLTRYNLKFPDINNLEDAIFTLYILCLAKKILLVPNIVYVYRKRRDSLSYGNSFLSAEEIIKRRGGLFFKGLALLNNFFDDHKCFEDNPLKKFELLKILFDWQLSSVANAYIKAPINEVNKFVRREISEVDDKVTTAAFFFDYMNLLTIENYSLNEVIKKQRRYMNYQRVQVQNLKSVFNGDELPQIAKD